MDTPSLASALRLLAPLRELVDIVEVGTPLILAEGMRAVAKIRRRFPGSLLADLKIMDAGELEAGIALEAGADIVTVLGAAHVETIAAVAERAHRAGKEAMVDLIGIAEPRPLLASIALAGVDLVCCHTAFDRQTRGESPTAALAELRRAVPTLRIAVAGGIDPSRVAELLPFSPEIIIVGGYVAKARDPGAAIRELRSALG